MAQTELSINNPIMEKIFVFFSLLLLCANVHPQCAEKISTGRNHTLIIKPDGSLWHLGMVGFSFSGDYQEQPLQIGTDTDWKEVEAGWYNSIGLKNDGTIWKWSSGLPQQIGTDSDWNSITMGEYNYAAIKNNGTLWTWGRIYDYNVAPGGPATYFMDTTEPVQVGLDTDWKEVNAGYYHFLAIKLDGSLWSWGVNGHGQVGDGTTVNRNEPFRLGDSNDWLAVSGGGTHSVALKTDHTIWVWGDGERGELGYTVNENPPIQTIPTLLNSNTYWKSIAASGEGTVAIKEDGSLWAWGFLMISNFGVHYSSFSPTLMDNGNWASIAAGFHQVLVNNEDSQTWVWGFNQYRQLGPGPSTKTFQLLDCAFLGEDDFAHSPGFSLYPNPVKDYLFIASSEALDIAKIIVSDASGKIVLEDKPDIGKLDLTSLQHGIYIVQIIGKNNTSYIKKIIKQ